MIFTLRHIITRMACAVLIGGVTVVGACSSTDEAFMPEGECVMGVYVRLGNSAGSDSSRATGDVPSPDETYQPGSDFESYIHIDPLYPDLRLYLFTIDDKLIAPLEEYSLIPIDTTDDYKTYELRFRVDRLIENVQSGVSFKVVMLANWRQYPSTASLMADETTISDLLATTEGVAGYTPSPAELTAADRLPMFGVTQYDNVKFEHEKPVVHPTPLWLLRAYAKIEVYDAPGTVAPITEVRLIRYNTKAYKAPKGVTHQNDYVKFGPDDDYVTTPTLPSEVSEWETSQEALLEKRASDGHYVIYVPEYRNIGRSEAERSTLKVTYKDGNSYTIDFKTHNIQSTEIPDGLPFDLLRNYWYKFPVKRNASELTWIADIQPFAEVDLDPFFGLDRDEDGNIVTERHDDGTYDVIIDNQIVTKDADRDIVIHRFDDGTLLCKEIVYKDYIHDNTEIDYEYVFEKDASGGNMVILRQISAGGTYHGDEVPKHDHGMDDRPLFVLDKKGNFHYVTYDTDGKPNLSRVDLYGDTIVQANGFQFRNIDNMRKYIGSYAVKKKTADTDPPTFVKELRYYKDGSVLDWNTGVPETYETGQSASAPGRSHAIVRNILQANAIPFPSRYRRK